MTESRRPRDFVYVHSDIPPGMTIREWRAQRPANRPASDRPLRLACGIAVRAAVAAAWRAVARALGRPRIARVRAHGGRHRAPRRGRASCRARCGGSPSSCAPPAGSRLQSRQSPGSRR